MLTTREVLRLRANIKTALPDTAAIVRDTLASDGQGGYTVTTAGTIATVSCRVASMGSSSWERQFADRIGTSANYILTMPHGTDVTAKDRIVVSGRTFEVVGLAPRVAWSLAVRVVATEVL